ncbi:MAG: hypothetical protein IT304_06415 [Dehalococcoidia bacterium]|nr:hypothetical protein [Dehalococcoidia bacterium]
MSSRAEVARAIAFFEETDDSVLLHELTRDIATRVKSQVKKLLAKGDEDAIPPPAELYPSRQAATQEQAVRTLHSTTDFALLQALARAIGRRIEAIEIVASAEFHEGTRVSVPEKAVFPPPATRLSGEVVQSGTMLVVQLDSGERWEGPPSLARREAAAASDEAPG